MTAQTMYVGEIASDEWRGALGSFMQLGIVVGILYVYCVGPYVSFQSYQCYCLIIPIAFVATFFFMPDSPHYYIQKGQEENAVKSLKFLRGKSTEGVQQELDEIRATVEESMKNKATIRDVFSNTANKKGDSNHIEVVSELINIVICSFYNLCWIINIPTTFWYQCCSFLLPVYF